MKANLLRFVTILVALALTPQIGWCQIPWAPDVGHDGMTALTEVLADVGWTIDRINGKINMGQEKLSTKEKDNRGNDKKLGRKTVIVERDVLLSGTATFTSTVSLAVLADHSSSRSIGPQRPHMPASRRS